MQSELIGRYRHLDGYTGNTRVAMLVFSCGYLFCAYPFGYIRSPHLPMEMADAREAKWLVANHPNGRKYYSEE